MHIDAYIALAGLIVGLAVGLTGMGGGSLMTPILVLVFGVQPLAAVSSDLVASLIMKPIGAAVHVGRRTVRWVLVGWLALGSVPAAFLGVVFLRSLGHGAAVQNVVQAALGSVLLLCVGGVLLRAAIDRRRQPAAAAAGGEPALRIRPVLTVAIGAVVGFVLGITSTGSGTLIVVMLLVLYPRLRGSQMVGTDLTQAIPMVGSAAVAHILFGDFKLGLTLSIVVGSVPGVLIGSLFSSQLGTRFIRAALCVVLLVSGLKLLGVPTLDLGVVLLAVLILFPSAWLVLRATGRPTPASTRVEAA